MIVLKKNVFLKIIQKKNVLQIKNLVQNIINVFQNVKKIRDMIQIKINVLIKKKIKTYFCIL